MKPVQWLIAGAWLAASIPFNASAQSSFGEAQSALEDCALDEPNGDTTPEAAEVAPGATGSLTDKLDPCDGILEPPPVGDREMTLTPPPTGTMPVVPPRALPEQPPQDTD